LIRTRIQTAECSLVNAATVQDGDSIGTVPVLEVRALSRVYRMGKRAMAVLRGVSFRVLPGEFVAIVGASGSGKSTLLHLMGCLDRPTCGAVFIEGQDVSRLTPQQLAAVRRSKIGFVFQMFNLLPNLTAEENVALPLAYSRWGRLQRRRRARAVLAQLGLAERFEHRPDQLSGGERQRVAVARALVVSPQILLADEPTGNLDSRNSRETLRLLRELREHLGVTIVLVTHDPLVAGAADRILQMQDGEIVEDRVVASTASV
jgi:putative ABC transport system ATP-binding protein